MSSWTYGFGLAGLLISLAMVSLMALRAMVWRHLVRAGAIHPTFEESSTGNDNLLPSQKKTVCDLTRSLRTFALDAEGPLWTLEGRWGEGKSHIVHSVQRVLAMTCATGMPDKCCIPVYVHVWREASEPDLHHRIVQTIQTHPDVLKHAFHAYSCSRLLARRLGKLLREVLPGGANLKFSDSATATMQVSHQSLQLLAQNELERVVAALRGKGIRLVLILDEIDRATPEVAQATIVLCRRSFNLPGMAVLLPYVPEQIRQKVFNPLIQTQPELFSSFMAMLLDDEEQGGKATRSVTRAPKQVASPVGFRRDAPQVEPPLLDRKQIKERQDNETLNRFYSKAHSDQRQRILMLTQEKFFERNVRVMPVSFDDLVALAKDVNHTLANELKCHDTPKNNSSTTAPIASFANMVKAAHQEMTKGAMLEDAPAIRHLLSRWRSIHDACKDSISKEMNDDLRIATHASLAALAWRCAQHMQAPRKPYAR